MKISKPQFAAFAAASVLLALGLPTVARADQTEAYKYAVEGRAAAKNKQWDKAINLFKKAVDADPKEANNHINLGLAYKGAGKLDDAANSFTKAIEAEPNNPAGYMNRGIVYISQNKYDKAIEDLTRAIKEDKETNVPAHRFRAFAYLEAKQWKQAIADYDIVIKAKENA